MNIYHSDTNGNIHLNLDEIKKYIQAWVKAIETLENDDQENKQIQIKYESCRNEAIEMGKILDRLGGFDLMQEVHTILVPPYLKRIVELFWTGIGEWQG